MSDSKPPGSRDDDRPKPLDGTPEHDADTDTTMRLRVLRLEGELWPEAAATGKARSGAGPANHDTDDDAAS